jgi:hypothetical protein
MEAQILLSGQTDRDFACKENVVLQKLYVGLERLSVREPNDTGEEKGGHLLSRNPLRIQLIESPVDVRSELPGRDLVLRRHRIGHKNSLLQSELSLSSMKAGDFLR